MGSDSTLTAEIIAKAESFSGIRAKIARLENVLNGIYFYQIIHLS